MKKRKKGFLGAVIGGVLGGPAGAVFGASIGHHLDKEAGIDDSAALLHCRLLLAGLLWFRFRLCPDDHRYLSPSLHHVE